MEIRSGVGDSVPLNHFEFLIRPSRENLYGNNDVICTSSDGIEGVNAADFPVKPSMMKHNEFSSSESLFESANRRSSSSSSSSSKTLVDHSTAESSDEVEIKKPKSSCKAVPDIIGEYSTSTLVGLALTPFEKNVPSTFQKTASTPFHKSYEGVLREENSNRFTGRTLTSKHMSETGTPLQVGSRSLLQTNASIKDLLERGNSNEVDALMREAFLTPANQRSPINLKLSGISNSSAYEIGSRQISYNILSEEYTELPPKNEVRYIEVPVMEDSVVTIPKRTTVDVEKIVPKYEYEYVDRVVTTPKIQYIDKIVEVPVIHEVSVPARPRKIIDVPREVIVTIPKVEMRIVEKIVEVPGEIIEREHQYSDAVEKNLKTYVDKETPVVVAQTIRRIVTESADVVDLDTYEYEPKITHVDIPVPKVIQALTEPARVQTHQRVSIPAAQYNSILKSLNAHIAEEELPFIGNDSGVVVLGNEESPCFAFPPVEYLPSLVGEMRNVSRNVSRGSHRSSRRSHKSHKSFSAREKSGGTVSIPASRQGTTSLSKREVTASDKQSAEAAALHQCQPRRSITSACSKNEWDIVLNKDRSHHEEYPGSQDVQKSFNLRSASQVTPYSSVYSRKISDRIQLSYLSSMEETNKRVPKGCLVKCCSRSHK